MQNPDNHLQDIESIRKQIDARLEDLIPAASSSLFHAARYSLLSPGKRLRPSLVLGTAMLFHKNSEPALDPACAIEMIHVYSLIHDDLPCMDNDDLRRGKPTLHKVVSEGMALLAGDYLLTFAFEIIANAQKLDPMQKVHLVQILSRSGGAQGMIGGQATDIEAAGQVIDEASLLQMHHLKTGALFAASLQFGAISVSAPPSYLPFLERLGLEIGLAFQFLDDLLDATASSEVLGKNVKRDALLKKPTAIQFYGIQGTKKRLADLRLSIDTQLQSLPQKAPLITALLHLYLWSRINK